jgi:hypothetical protein
MESFVMEMVFTLEEAVLKYGNKSIQKAFEKKKLSSAKGKGNINTNQTNQLKTTFEQHYRNVEIVGKGAKREFHCEGERFEMLDRIELLNYANCGQGQLPYKEDIREAILTYLSNTDEITTTYRHLLRRLGILGDVLYVACRKFSVNEQKKYYENLDDKYKQYGHAVFWDVVQREYSRLESNIESVLIEMAKKKIIKVSNVTNVAYKGKKEHETLHVFEAKKVDDKKRELREKYDVTVKDLLFKTKSKSEQIKAYNHELEEYFEPLGIDYVYDAIAVYINATKKEIDLYKARELTKTIRQKHLQHAYEKALERQEKSSSQLLDLLGGKAKPKHTFNKFVSETPTNQELIKLEKECGTYADSYRGTLESINSVKEMA